MGIVLFVTIYAVVLGKAVIARLFMTRLTGDGPVLAFQLEVGPSVIENFVIQLNNIHVATFMVGMAGMTFPGVYLMNVAVETTFFLDVIIYLLMTVAAQFALFGFIKSLVAFVAFGFKPGMPLDNITGHNQPLHTLNRTYRCQG
jgi:hypothetical protein